MGQKQSFSHYKRLPLDLVGQILSYTTLLPKYGHLHSTLHEVSKSQLKILKYDTKNSSELLDMIENLGILVAEDNVFAFERFKYLVHCYPQDEIKCFALEVARANGFFRSVKVSCSLLEYIDKEFTYSMERRIHPTIGWLNNMTYTSTLNTLELFPAAIFRMQEFGFSDRDIGIFLRVNRLSNQDPDYKLFQHYALLSDIPSPSLNCCGMTIGEIIILMAKNDENKPYIKKLFKRYRIPKNQQLLNIYMSL